MADMLENASGCLPLARHYCFTVIIFPKNKFFSFSLVRYSGHGAVSVMKEQKKKCSQTKGGEPPGKIFGSLAG